MPTSKKNPAPKEGQVWRAGSELILILRTYDTQKLSYCWLHEFRNIEPVNTPGFIKGCTYVCDLTNFGDKLLAKILATEAENE